jgi:hypothetical protein
VTSSVGILPPRWRLAVRVMIVAALPLIVGLGSRLGLGWPGVEWLSVMMLLVFPLPLAVGTAALLYLLVGVAMRMLERGGRTPSPPVAALIGAGLGTMLLCPFWGITVSAIFGGLIGGLAAVLVVPGPPPMQLIWEEDDD